MAVFLLVFGGARDDAGTDGQPKSRNAPLGNVSLIIGRDACHFKISITIYKKKCGITVY